MADSIWPAVHAERTALADDLAGLSDADWQVPSLCADWNVHQVLAHQLTAARMTPPKFFASLAGSGFRFNAYAAKEVARDSEGGPAATLARFREAIPRTTAPPGPKDTWLGEVIVHSEDIRRPLGIVHDYPLDPVVRVLNFYAKSNAIIGGRNRVAGLRLHATDADVSVGDGPVIDGAAIDLVLAASGRESGLAKLSGPGLEALRARF